MVETRWLDDLVFSSCFDLDLLRDREDELELELEDDDEKTFFPFPRCFSWLDFVLYRESSISLSPDLFDLLFSR